MNKIPEHQAEFAVFSPMAGTVTGPVPDTGLNTVAILQPSSTSAMLPPDDSSAATEKVEMVRADFFSANPHSTDLYSQVVSPGLLESVTNDGVKVPIRALSNGKLIDGWQRVEAAKESGWKLVPTIFVDVRPDSELHWILLYNSQRIKSIPDRLREFRAYLKIEREKATERVGIRTDLDQGLPEGHPQFGKSHELAAKKVGLSGTSARNGLRVLEEIERRGESDGTEKALKILTERGINAAFKFAYSHGWIDASVKPRKRKASKNCDAETQATSTELKDDSAPRSEDASEKTLPVAGWMTDDLIDEVITGVAPTDSEGADVLRKTISHLRPTSALPKTGEGRLSKLQLVRSLVPRAAEVLPDRHIAEPLEALSELVVRLDAIIGSVRPSDRKLGARALAALRVVDPKRAEAFAEAAVGTALAQAIAEAEAPTGSTSNP